MIPIRSRHALAARNVLIALALLTVTFPPLPGVAAPPAQAECETFYVSGVYPTICDRFAEYWRANGGLAQQGYPLTPEMLEINQQDGKKYTVQYFERAVFEHHWDNTPPWDVELSLLGAFFYHTKYPGPQGAPNQRPNQTAGSIYFAETGKRLGGRFLEYWQSNGGLAQQGRPISDEFSEKSATNGQTYTVQYFERAVFEWHPENQRPYDVLLSQLGTFRLHTALLQPYTGNDAHGWICHAKGHDDERCFQNNSQGPATSNGFSEPADFRPPTVAQAQPGDILLANTNGILSVRFEGRTVRLMKSTKVGLWPGPVLDCTSPDDVTLLSGNPEIQGKRLKNMGEVLVPHWGTPLNVTAGRNCVHPMDQIEALGLGAGSSAAPAAYSGAQRASSSDPGVYAVRLWPDQSVDVADYGGTQNVRIIDPTGATTKEIVPGQQVHASPAGVVGQPGPLDSEFTKAFTQYNDPNLPPSLPQPDPPRPPGWASSLLLNGDIETGGLAPWTTPINGGSAALATQPRRAGTYATLISGVAQAGVPSGIGGGGTCPGGNRVPIAPFTPYSWAGWAFVPESDARTTAYLHIGWYSACTGGSLLAVTDSAHTQATGQWTQVTGQGVAPGGAHFALVDVLLVSVNNVQPQAYFDDLQMNVAGPPVATPTPGVSQPLSEGFENGPGNFSANAVPTPVGNETPGPDPGWTRTQSAGPWGAHTGAWAMYASDEIYPTDQTLATINPIAIPANALNATLSFWQRYELGNGGYPYPAPSAGVLETSIDGGNSWQDVLATTTFLQGGYNGSTGPTASSSSQPLGDNRASWIGDTGGNFTQVRVNLRPFAGKNLRFRFRLGTPYDYPYSSPDIGWQIDDILLSITTPNAAGRVVPLQAFLSTSKPQPGH